MFDCPKCVTVCKAPHCVTHCQVNITLSILTLISLYFDNNVLIDNRLPNQNVKLFAKNQNVTGNATNQTAPNQNVSQSVKILTASPRLTVALAMEALVLLLLSPSSKKLKLTNNAAVAELSEKDKEPQVNYLKLLEPMVEALSLAVKSLIMELIS